MAGKSKEMELAIKIAGKIDKSFNTALSAVNKGIRGVTKTLAIGVTAAAVAVGAITMNAVEIGKAFESSMSQVAATLQLDTATEAGAAQYAILEEAARQCGRETAFSASEAAEGLNQLAMAGYKATDAAMALPTVLRLAGAGGIEMADSARYITASLASLGLERTENNFNHLADVMAITAAKAKTDVSQIGEAITTLGGTGQGLKGGINEISASLGVLANADITGSEGGTHLRNLILALQNPRNKVAAAMFQDLGVQAYDAQGNMCGLNEIFIDLNTAMAGMTSEQRNSVIATLFKQTDLAAARAMLQGCGEEYDNLYQEALNASNGLGAAQEMYNTQLDNLEGDMSILHSALEDVGISIYQKIQPALRGAAQSATEFVNAFGTGFENGGLMGGISAVIEKLTGMSGMLDKIPEPLKQIGAAAAAIGGVNLLSAFFDSGMWNSGVKNVQQFGGVLKMLPMQAGKTFGPLGKIMQGFGLNAAQSAQKAWGAFTNDNLLGAALGKVGGFVGKVGGELGKVGNVVSNVGGKLFQGLTTMMSVAMKMLMPAALIGGLLVGLGLLQGRFGEQIDGLLTIARAKGPLIIQHITEGITSRIPQLITQGATLVTNLLNTIGALAPSLVMAGAQIIVALVNGVAQNAPALIGGAITAVGGFLTGILQALPMLLMCGMNLLLSLAQGIVQNLPMMIQGAITAIQGFIQGFISYLPEILRVAAQIVVTLISGLFQALPMLISGAWGIFSSLIQTIMSIDWLAVGADIIKTIGGGIVSGAKGVWDGIKNAMAGGGKEDASAGVSAPATPVAPSVSMPSTSSYTSAGLQGAAAYAMGFQSGAPRISSATQAAVNNGTSGVGLTAWETAGLNGAASFTGGIDAGMSAYNFDPSTIGLDISGFQSELESVATTGGDAFTTGLDSSIAGYNFDTSSIGVDTGALSSTMSQGGTEGGNALITSLQSAINAGAGSVTGAAQNLANGVSNAVSSGFSKAKSSAVSAMNSLKSSCVSSAKSTASSIKSAFERISIKIPKPKIPVVSVSSSSYSVGGQTVSVPKFDISWHALGGIFNRATLLQSMAGGAHVVGESGPEAILPLDTLWDKMRQILQEILQGNGPGVIEDLLNRLEGKGSTTPAPVVAGEGGGGTVITFSPTYNLYGSATKEDAEKAGRATFEEFKRFMEQYERDKARKKF